MGNDLDKTMQDVIDSQPEVSKGAIEKSTDQKDHADNYGRAFDPSLHLVDDEGNPQLTAKGKLRVKKGKSPSKIATGKAASQQPESYRQCAEVVCGTIFGFGQLVAGDEAKPSTTQANFMIDSYERYFETKGIEDIPPGLAVFMATTAYCVPVFIKTVRKKESNIHKAMVWVKDKFAKRNTKEPKIED